MDNSNIKIVSALVIGAAIGGILGVLLAPKKGSKTRKLISEKTDDLGNLAKEKLHDVLDNVKNEIKTVTEKVGHYVSDRNTK